MDPKLPGLLGRLDELLSERAELERAYRAGRTTELPLPRLFHAFRAVTRPDTFFELREALEGAPAGSALRAQLERVCRALCELGADARAAESLEAIAHFEATFAPWRELPGVPVLDALRLLPREPVRARRLLLSQAVGRELRDHRRPYAAVIDARFEVAERLGFEGPLALHAAFHPPLEPLLAECEAFLAATEDAYRDLLGYVLRRAEPTLKNPGAAADLTDLQRACAAPWTFGELSRGALTHALRRWIEDWQLAVGAGRVELDDADTAGKGPTAQVTPVRPPRLVHLAVRVEAGVGDALQLLHGQGQALCTALSDPRLPVDERRLAGEALPAAFGTLFGRLGCDPLWLERCLRATRSQARDLARLFAFAELTRVRTACAQLAFERWLLQRGPGAEVEEAYEAEHRRASRVTIPTGEALRGALRPLQIADALRGAAVGGRLPFALRERYDEDYWRNPAAAAALRAVAAQPGVAHESLARLCGGDKPPSLLDGVGELLRTLGA